MKLRTTLLTKFMLFLFAIPCVAQGEADLFKGGLWIKPIQDSAITQTGYFNFNPVIDFGKSKIDREYKKIILKEVSVFMVFRSDSKNETTLVTLKRSLQETRFTNTTAYSDTEFKYEHANPAQGVLLSFRHNNNAFPVKKKGNLIFEDAVYDDKSGENQFMEMICVPRFVSNAEKGIAESYLSVKYGISLQGEKDYVNALGDTIWKYKQNEGFNNRVTGVGRDDKTGLYQKQSGNSKKDGLYLGLGTVAKCNAKNTSHIPDRAFLLWGDNDGDIDFKGQLGEARKMKRVWQVQPVSEQGAQIFDTQLVIARKEMFPREKYDPENPDYIWLAIDTLALGTFGYQSAQYIRQLPHAQDSIVYQGVRWKSGLPAKFTFIKAPDFFILPEIVQENCLGKSGKAQITAVGGKAPYKINLLDENGIGQEYSSTDGKLTIEGLEAGNYTLKVTDSFDKSKTITFSTSPFPQEQFSLAPQWYLRDDGSVTLSPVCDIPNITYNWIHNGQTVSNQKEFQAAETGKYQLELTNADGCSKILEAEVLGMTSNLSGDWTVYPNPAGSTQQFHIRFNLEKPTATTVAIADVNGKVLVAKDLGIINSYDFKETLLTAGTYLLRITKAGVVETGKLIIK